MRSVSVHSARFQADVFGDAADGPRPLPLPVVAETPRPRPGSGSLGRRWRSSRGPPSGRKPKGIEDRGRGDFDRGVADFEGGGGEDLPLGGVQLIRLNESTGPSSGASRRSLW